MPATIRWQRLLALPITLLVALALILTVAAPADAAARRRENKVDAAMKVVRNQKGDPYSYGAAGPSRFDCSGLIYYSFRKAGIKSIPRTSSAQYDHVRHIRKRNVRRGDLVFFHGSSGVYHAGVFAGRRDGQAYIVHASKPGTDVKRDPIWTNDWKGGTLRLKRG